MADRKKASTRKRTSRLAAAKAAAPEAKRTEAATGASPARVAKPRARRTKAAETASVVSLFDTQLPAEMRAAIEAAETVTPLARAVPASAVLGKAGAPAARFMEAGAEQAGQAFARARTTGESLRQALTETAHATTLGALDVNGKVIEALQAQSDAAFDLWRAALKANSLSDAISLQTSGARQVYETATNHWANVAESARRWLGATVGPIQSAWAGQTR